MSDGKNNGAMVSDAVPAERFLVFTDTWKGLDGRQEHRFSLVDDWQRFMLRCIEKLSHYPAELYAFERMNHEAIAALESVYPDHIETIRNVFKEALTFNGKD